MKSAKEVLSEVCLDITRSVDEATGETVVPYGWEPVGTLVEDDGAEKIIAALNDAGYVIVLASMVSPPPTEE